MNFDIPINEFRYHRKPPLDTNLPNIIFVLKFKLGDLFSFFPSNLSNFKYGKAFPPKVCNINS